MPFSYENLPLKVSAESLNPNPAKVGAAAASLLSKPYAPQSAEETTEAMTSRYYEELLSTVAANEKKYESPFYIVVLRKKEPWAINVLRQWFIARQTRPTPEFLRNEYPNHDHDLYKIDSKSGDVHLCWTLLSAQDCASVLKNKDAYSEDLVNWIMQFNRGTLR